MRNRLRLVSYGWVLDYAAIFAVDFVRLGTRLRVGRGGEGDYFRRLFRGRERLFFGKQVLIFSVQLFSVNKTGWGLAKLVLSRTDACCEDFGSIFI